CPRAWRPRLQEPPAARKLPPASRLAAGVLYSMVQKPPGTTGFDVVGSWGWLRVEVPGGLVKHPGNNKCGLAHVRPRSRCLAARPRLSRPPIACGGEPGSDSRLTR